MKVIVDTSIWSLALRRKRPVAGPETEELQELIDEFRVQVLGPIRQEILSGISDEELFGAVEQHLGPFPDVPMQSEDYVKAASFYNICRLKGVQGSNTDFLICAVAARLGYSIYADDKDFEHYSKHLPIKLHTPRRNPKPRTQ